MTQSDKDKLFECISADFKIVTRRTELWQMDYCENILHDVGELMERDYLSMVQLIMKNQYGLIIRCNQYTIELANTNTTNDKPGNIDWDGIGGTNLNIILTYTKKWHDLSVQQKTELQNILVIPWYASFEDVSLSSLKISSSKNFSSSKSAVKREDFKR
ncbi:hypothetical protein LC612_39210 [Nostoc sp. CHAB 5834]|nr:hypothetical protein [Nostoc sp. CHAB 5834]